MDLNFPPYYPGILDFPDIHGGRISVSSSEELLTILSKTINYEKNPYMDQLDWYNKINLSAYFDPAFNEDNSGNIIPWTEECFVIEGYYFIYTSLLIEQFFTSSTNYSINSIFLNYFPIEYPEKSMCWGWFEPIPTGLQFITDGSVATDQLVQVFNDGCFIINHHDHGKSRNCAKWLPEHEGWVHPMFDQNHLGLLDNGNKLPIVFSLNYQTGWFDAATDQQYYQNGIGDYDCLGELLLSKEKGGAVGFIGASRNARGAYTDELDKGFFDAIWPEFDQFPNVNQVPLYKLGAIKDYGLLFMYDKFILGNTNVQYEPSIYYADPWYTRRQIEDFNVLGDPTLEMWTGVPQPLYAYVNFDDNSVTIYDVNEQIVPDTKVVFQYGPEATEDYEVKMTDANGKVYSNLLKNFNVEVSALKHNYIPWYSTIISGNTTWPGDEDIRGNIIINSGGNLTFGDDITLPKYARIIVMEGGTLSTSAYTNVSFSNDFNDILVYGNLDFAENTSFDMAGTGLGKIKLLNETIAYTFNDVSFDEFIISGEPLSVGFYLSNLHNCTVEIEKANVSVTTTGFNGSSLIASNPRNNLSYVHITNNSKFYGIEEGVYIEGYLNFLITGSEFYECQDGIQIFNAGGAAYEKTVLNNTIYSNSCTGLTIYHSYADVLHNNIYENGFGIKSLNRSVVHLEGDSHEVTQEIKDNNNAEVYATRGSFPQYFRWNLVQDDYNQANDPMVLYDGPDTDLDVRYNCWGNTFSPEADLSPAGHYIWDPVWKCDLGEGSGESSEAESMYLAARSDIENEDYSSAQTTFQQIIVQYPATKYAQAALKELYSLEKLLNNDYAALKTYYNTEQSILNNSDLLQLADFLVNFCEIKLENWPTAIAWFEDVIQNPASMEDSIFAIIDLGYTYFLMEQSGYKSAYQGSITEHIPVSQEQFTEKRNYLLSLIPKQGIPENLDESLSSLKPGELLQNIPNPFTGTTQIWYKLENEAVVQLTIYNNTGQLIRTIDEGNKAEGLHHIDFDTSGLTIGTYYYSISINGQTTDSKKMTIMK